MSTNILNFLQAIQQSDTIPDTSPIFKNPFDFLKKIGFETTEPINNSPSSDYYIFERQVDNITEQFSVHYDAIKSSGYIDAVCFIQYGMNIKHITSYNDDGNILLKEIIPDKTYNYCLFSYFYTYNNENLIETDIRHRPSPTTLPEINVKKIIMVDNHIEFVEFVCFYNPLKIIYLDQKPSDYEIKNAKTITFSSDVLKAIIDIDIEKYDVNSLLKKFPISITKEQECLICMSNI